MAEETLKGKTALVTGASRRIGRVICLALACEGVNVLIHYNSARKEARRLCAELAEYGVNSWLVKADFGNSKEYDNLISRGLKIAGSLDILVNNASVFLPGRLKEMSFDDLRLHIQVNAWVPLVLSRGFARLVKTGKIINLLDARIRGYDFLHVPYILSKNLLFVLTEMMALEFAPDITVNGVAPGLILPPPSKDKRYLEKLMHTVPLKRHGSPKDIANAVVYLLRNDFVTGQIINVDGGLHLKEYGNGPNPDK
jgi:pteridine reductase